MARIIVLIVAFMALIAGVMAAEDKLAKLQIGILKKISPEECTQKARKGDTVSVHYTGKLEDGTVFDSSVERGTPIQFPLGTGRVIPGWDQGILGMCVGEKRKLTIPPHLAYGKQGAGRVIPPDSTLIFTTELVSIDNDGDRDEL